MQKTSHSEKVNATNGDVLDAACIVCVRETEHKVMSSFRKETTTTDRFEEWSVNWIENYQVIRCGGCKNISFRQTYWFSEDQDFDSDGRIEWLYPKRGVDNLSAKPLPNVPTPLRRLYGEVVECYNNDSLTLCAAGLRALVEGFCADRGVVDGPVTTTLKTGKLKTVRKTDLRAKIFGLHEKNLLTQASAEILHEHRVLGNEAVHELARPAQDSLKLAFEIVEHMLEQLYELPHKANALKMSRKKSLP